MLKSPVTLAIFLRLGNRDTRFASTTDGRGIRFNCVPLEPFCKLTSRESGLRVWMQVGSGELKDHREDAR